MGVTERRQHIGQRALREVVRGAQPHTALQPGRAELGFGARQRLQDQPGVHEQRLAIGGQAQGVGVADKQAPAHAVFEPADMVADRRLREAELPAGIGETARRRHGGEGLDPDGIEHRPIVIGLFDCSQ
ncbi:hypothetical protein D3C86_1764670 [compost metagenome]